MSRPFNDTPQGEQARLDLARTMDTPWRLWGAFLAERAWGSVREDYSSDGEAWSYLPHDHARSRAYRWSEDGLAGISDRSQNLCWALCLWNGQDKILKERAFGLSGKEGNHGEDVKEIYFYRDATPTHSWLNYLYKYPQAAFPYDDLRSVSAARSRSDPTYTVMDTGVFDHGHWDVEVAAAKSAPTHLMIRVRVTNRGAAAAHIHLLPTLWCRNTWSWGDAVERPLLVLEDDPEVSGAKLCVRAESKELGNYWLYSSEPSSALFTENETNFERLYGTPNAQPYVKDAFHRHVIQGEAGAVNPLNRGTKMAAWSQHDIEPGASHTVYMVLSAERLAAPFDGVEEMFGLREAESDEFYWSKMPHATDDEMAIFRQSLSGLIWNQQFYHYDVERWLQGDLIAPSALRGHGRNHAWKNLKAKDVMSMPDSWEYPWFASWDLALQCGAIALVDVDFAKSQVELLLKEYYLHADGQLPAYEWAFGDANPPLLGMAALKMMRAERVQRGKFDHAFMQRVLNKLLLHYAWWLNRKDSDGKSVFSGGFLGLDNISVYDRSQPLPAGYELKQSDATGWMAMFALNMTLMALELTSAGIDYEDIAIQCYMQFLAIANTIGGHAPAQDFSLSLWDPTDGFFKDLVVDPDGQTQRIDVFSWVGIIPLFACEVVDERLLASAPRFRKILDQHDGGFFRGNRISAAPDELNKRGERMLALVDDGMLPRILDHLFAEAEFLSPYGIRSVSKVHDQRRNLGEIRGIGTAMVEYVPGESNSALFGGNSNWRGPIWMPTNYILIQCLEKYYRFLGPDYMVSLPCLQGEQLDLRDVAQLLSSRIVDLFRENGHGVVPARAGLEPRLKAINPEKLHLFPEYFHGDLGVGLGAMHQTGWTALVANLVHRRTRAEAPGYWRRNTP
jgi:hypothetical protein